MILIANFCLSDLAPADSVIFWPWSSFPLISSSPSPTVPSVEHQSDPVPLTMNGTQIICRVKLSRMVVCYAFYPTHAWLHTAEGRDAIADLAMQVVLK